MSLRAAIRGAGLLTLEVAALVVLHRSPLPSVTWSDLQLWLDSTPPEDAVVALVRSLALVTTYYLVATTALVVLAECLRIPSLVRGVRLISLPGVRRAIEGVVAVSIVSAPLVSGSPASSSISGATLPATDVSGYTPTPAGDSEVYVPHPAGDARPSMPTVHHVVRGESLWSIAEAAVPASAPDRRRAVDRYWRSLVDLNSETLRSGDPNLIFPGESVVLPPPEVAGPRGSTDR